LKQAKDALKPVYGSRKVKGDRHLLDSSDAVRGRGEALSFDEKALQLRKVKLATSAESMKRIPL
jgi:hypothetical protein